MIETATDVFASTNTLEVSLEANPSSVEQDRFRDYAAAGVNRVSLGVQALNDNDLRALGRLHSMAEARAAIEVAQATFDRVSFDLIYARQHQDLAAWEDELTLALTIGTDHLSLYQLTIEPGTAFGARHARGGLAGLPGEDLSADMYELTQSLCEAAGMPAYETSNHARSGSECVHNLVYWRSGDYAGVGPGAHGRLTRGGQRYATEAIRMPDAWLETVRVDGSGQALHESIDDIARLEEYVMMGLRTTEGIDIVRLKSLGGVRADTLNKLIDDGWLATSDGRLSTTARGRPLLNAILRELLV